MSQEKVNARKEYKKNIGLKPDGLYINAGVLLINLEKLRKVDISKRLGSYMTKYEKLINYADQDVLNGTFEDDDMMTGWI